MGIMIMRGKWLSEPSLYVYWVHCGDLTAATHAALLCVDALRFEELVGSYPVVRAWAAEHAADFVRALNICQSEADDLFDSICAWPNMTVIPEYCSSDQASERPSRQSIQSLDSEDPHAQQCQ